MSHRKVELKSYKQVPKEEDDDDDIVQNPQYSSSSTKSASLIAAFSENAFKQSEKATVIKNRRDANKIDDKEAASEYAKAYETIAHSLDKETLETEYCTSLKNGLTTQQVTELQATVGFNELIPPKRDPEWLRFIKCTWGNLLSTFWSVCAILALILYAIDPRDPPDDNALFLGFFLIIVVVLTGLFIFYVDGKASSLMTALSSIEPKSVMVIRDNAKTEIDPKYLVPGDIVQLTMGISLPADMRVFQCSSDLQVDNSSLTGESEPQQRSSRKESMDVIPAESSNLVFYGTFILNGNGLGCVIATGNNTFMGRTAALASYTEEEITPLMAEINDLVKKLSVFASIIGLVVFIPSMVISPDDWMRNLMILISLIITNIPGGLLVVTCIQLTLTAKVLFHKNVQIKQLGSVETLGSATVICSDKTGTLTTNVMTVQHIYYNSKQRICDTLNPLHALKGDFYDDKERKVPNQDFLRLVRCGILCNNAEFLEENGQMDPTANATEAAILKFSSGQIVSHYKENVKEYRKRHRKLHEIPFNSKNKWQVSVHELPDHITANVSEEIKTDDTKRKCIVQMKGAPERILNLCDRHLLNGDILPITDDDRAQIMKDILDLGAKGERVLAFAELILNSKEYDISVEEPVIEEKYGEEVDEKCAKKDAVIVVYDETKIEINMQHIDEEKEKSFDGHTVEDLMRCIEKHEYALQIPLACQRLAYSDYGLLESDQTFGELGITRGSVLYLFKGPYKFAGTCTNDVNWPFNRAQDKEGLVFIGLFAMIDPPRPGVPEAVETCWIAGVQVIMVTGDHPVTAKAIAEKVGIIHAERVQNILMYDSKDTEAMTRFADDDFDAIVVPGWELQNVLDQEPDDANIVIAFWNKVIHCKHVVFARTSPQQKLLIVAAVQERGAIVAVTGDGVNDSPALKKANIGVAMGITGTQVAKESANMILLDDDFSTIITGIKQGRIIFDNLKKSIAYSLGKCMAQVMPFVVTVAFGLPLPLTPLLLLVIDGGTDLIPAISLCFEEDEADIMKRPPRNAQTEHLATLKLIFNTHLVYGILGACAGLYGYFTVLYSFGYTPLHIIDGMDEYSVFSYNGNRNEDALRDAYNIWCFQPEITTKCYYYPNFVNATLINTESNKIGWYYDQDQWYSYQRNAAGYVKESKEYLVSHNINNLTMYMLNGEDRNGVTCCNKCTQPTNSFCNEDYLDWDRFYNEYWSSGLLDTFRQNVYTNNLFPTRRCWKMDYFSLYTEYRNQPVTGCDFIDHPDKPRTNGGIHSLFPMDTRSRTEALSRAQTALVMAIFFMQLAHLLTVRTRKSSIFQQGMSNEFMNYGLLYQIFLISIVIYWPFMNILLGSKPLRFVWWTPSWPFVIFIFCFHECRKGIVRKRKSKFVDFVTRNTYW